MAQDPGILPYATPSFYNDFTFEELLGEGTYGSVWRCARLAQPGARLDRAGGNGVREGSSHEEVPPSRAMHHHQGHRQGQHHNQQQQQQRLEHLPQQQQQRHRHPQKQRQQQHHLQLEPKQEGQEGGAVEEWYACKVVQKSKLTSKSKREDLRREVALLKLFSGQHGSIVQLHGVYESSSSVKLVMEYCAGGDLFDLLCAHGRLPEAAAKHVFKQVASAVAYCHSCGVLHRDIKPENILFDQNAESLYNMGPTTDLALPGARGASGASERSVECPGAQPSMGGGPKEGFRGAQGSKVKAKLADFGLSVIIGRQGVASGYTGSRFYTAPEMVRGWTYGMRADVWSLGVVLFTMLTGRLPFAGRDDGDLEGTRMAILRGTIDYDQPAWDGVSESAKDLVRAMLRVDPMKRIHSHEVLAHPWLTGGVRAIPKVLVAPPVSQGAGLASSGSRRGGHTGVPGAPLHGAHGVHDGTTRAPTTAPTLAGACGIPEVPGLHGVYVTPGIPGVLPSSMPGGAQGNVAGAPDAPGGVPRVEAWAQPWQMLLECSSRESDSSCISQSTTDAGSPSPGAGEGGTPAAHHCQAPFESPLPGGAYAAAVHPRDTAPCESPLQVPGAVKGCGKGVQQPGEEHEEDTGTGQEGEGEEGEGYEEGEGCRAGEDAGVEEGCGGGQGRPVYERHKLYLVKEEEEGGDGEEEAREEGSEDVRGGGSEESNEEPAVRGGVEGQMAARTPGLHEESDAVTVLAACAKLHTKSQTKNQTQKQKQKQGQKQKQKGDSQVGDIRSRSRAETSRFRAGDRSSLLPDAVPRTGEELGLQEESAGTPGAVPHQQKSRQPRSGKVKPEKLKKGKKAQKNGAQSLLQAADVAPPVAPPSGSGTSETRQQARTPPTADLQRKEDQPRSLFQSQGGDSAAQSGSSTAEAQSRTGEAQEQKKHARSMLQSPAGGTLAQPGEGASQVGSGTGEAQSRIGDSRPRTGHTQTRRQLTRWFRLGRREAGEKKADKGKKGGAVP